jgi:hypothetical protein
MNHYIEVVNPLKSRYVYNNNETGAKIFICELEIMDFSGVSYIIRKLIKSRSGFLVVPTDAILFSNINKYKLTIVNINDMSNIINIENACTLDNNIIKTNNIVIHFQNINNLVQCSYNILF